MLKKHVRTFAGIGAAGAAALLFTGCGGNSFQKNTFGNYPNTLPYAYGVEPVALFGLANNIGAQGAFEGSGFQAVTGGQAYLTGASDFVAVTASGAVLPANADPNTSGKLPLGFSTGGLYIDNAQTVAGPVASVASLSPGTQVVFRVALANGISNNNTSGITGATLTTSDPQMAAVAGLTAGLPMTLNVVTGPFSNATYVAGTNGTPTPFTIPAGLPSGLHTVKVNVSDDAGRTTATTFEFPVLATTDVALFLQSFTTAVAATKTAAATTTATPIQAGDTVTVDGGAGSGTYPTGFTPTVADAQGTVVLFTKPGTHTVVETNAKGVVVQTATFTIPATAAGTTIFSVPVGTAATSGTGGASGAVRAQILSRH